MAVSLAPLALKGNPGVQIMASVGGGWSLNHITSVDVRSYGVAFVSTDASSNVQCRYLVPWTSIQVAGPNTTGPSFVFDEIRFSESGADITLTLTNLATYDCTAVDVRDEGVVFEYGGSLPTFRPWSQIASLSQAVS